MTSSYKFQSLLEKGIHINQFELILNEKLSEYDQFFYRTPAEWKSYKQNNKRFKKRLEKKMKDDDNIHQRLDAIIKQTLKDPENVLQDDQEFNDVLVKYEEMIENLWTPKDKQDFNYLFDEYARLTLKKNTWVKVIWKVRKNKITKFLIEFLIYTFSFLAGYPIKKILAEYVPKFVEYIFGSSTHQLFLDYLYAVIIFFTVRIVMEHFKKKAQLWRVNKLYQSYILLFPIVLKAKEYLKKKEDEAKVSTS